ncbi:NEL-type E3 ubiquitin ligase domain-containing protein [Pseudomonas sp. FP453]|uniref:dermonecrotic toxin domain-containing protein n=1 Tax=Pseudomonas sp. FP453 TaxID=2954094 RepID=UPI0027351181|nr:DUF6543 domain-containing protein [Pseudomonas sp. FP453]WLH91475.1 NEL-type E3 ubiquitin ligase domain-containing protein [Pseudomonas sp. FP453]
MPATPDKGPHYALIKNSLPDWLHASAWHRTQALGRASLERLPELIHAPAALHAPLKAANAQAWARQNSVDQRLKDLQDVYTFAEPLLVAALQRQYGLTLDVRATHVFLVSRRGTILQGSTSRTVSLLDAALQNFASNERFTDSSRYVRQPDARGQFNIETHHTRMSIEQFVDLCRELDLGAQYAKHLQTHLQPALEADRNSLQAQVIASQQAALNAAAHLARLRGEIDPATFHLLQRAVKGERGVMQFYRLRLMDTLLTGVLLIANDLDLARDVAPVVAYIPHDPHGAIQAYPSTLAFREALAKKLQDPAYRQFFSQFIDRQQQRAFIHGLQQRAPYSASRIDGELWPQLYQAALNKILNDGREQAVSTAQADRRARWAWWDTFSHILESALNVVLLVATPFVPLLGEAMLAYTAYQLLDEVVEGVVDLARGQALEAARHLVGVLTDVVQLATFSVGGKLLESAFVNQLKAVEVKGKSRLWNPDPTPYRQSLPLPAESTPDELGVHTHAGQRILPVDGAHYVLSPNGASGDYRIQHASRPDAYAPPIRRNPGPRAWSDTRRLRELGPFNPAQQQQILATSGLDHDTLRAVQTDNLVAPLLDDTVKRVRLNQQAAEIPEQLRTRKPVDQDTYWSPYIARELPGWPQDRAILVYENADLSGDHLRFGEADATLTLSISRDDLNLGKLPERLVDNLDSTELTTLLGTLPEGRTQQIDALRNRLADHLAQRQGSLFAYLYRHSEDLVSERGLQVREACPGLPKSLVEHVLSQAWPEELNRLDTHKQLPLRLKNLAREWQLQAKAAHAYQGFYDPQLLGPDTEQMLLDTLRVYSDSLEDCRIEIRQHTAIAKLRASAGPHNARAKRLLLKNDGHYEIHDNGQAREQPATDLFNAVLAALPPAKRQALGYAPGDGAAFKRWVMDTLRAPAERRRVLADPVLGETPAKDTLALVQKPMHRAASWFCDLFPNPLERRVKALYPYADPGVIDTYLQTLDDPLQLQRFAAREVEKDRLQEDLLEWVNAAPDDEPITLSQQRLTLARGMLRAWEANIETTVQTFSIRGVQLPGELGNLPLHANFDHLLHLELAANQLLDSDMAILDHFPRLISLSLRGNQLTRLPPAVGRMTSLTQLSFMDERVQWDTADLAQLGELTQLQRLNLSDNRQLTRAPNLGDMAQLQAVSLNNTAIEDWPDGLFEQPRPSGFELDLQNTAINNVPQFLPWTPEAEVVAWARLDRNRLTADGEQRLVSYRLAAGLDPYRTYPPKGDSTYWVEKALPQHQPGLKSLWQDLEQEHGSQGFFEVIKSLEFADIFETLANGARHESGRAQMTDKVWRMLRAMHDDHTLRSRLFLMASHPVNCADAGAQVFNSMGVQVRLAEIHRLPNPALRERELAELARGKSRLDRLNRFIQADIAQRIKPRAEGGQGLRYSSELVDGVPGTVDEVEVYLAYQTALQERLKLPWISPHMSYRRSADVSPKQLQNAFDNVQVPEAGDGLVKAMLEQPFWDQYLRETYAPTFQASLDHGNALLDPLDDLLFAQNQWANASATERQAQTPRLLALADALNVPHAEVLSGQPMSTATYERILAAGFTADLPSQTDLARRLTREALQRLEAHEAGNA